MILEIQGSLGDSVLLTGIPEAYFKLTGEKTFVMTRFPVLFENNPYITTEKSGKKFTNPLNSSLMEFMIYYPVLVYWKLFGVVLNREQVHPNLYLDVERENDLVLVNDQAGWPSRRGYPYFGELVDELSKDYRIMYMISNNYRDCVGKTPAKTVTSFDYLSTDQTVKDIINQMAKSSLYIGYDSGYSTIANATKTPYVYLAGSVPPVSTLGDTCIYSLTSCKRCAVDTCQNRCLENTPNVNGEILKRIKDVKHLYTHP